MNKPGQVTSCWSPISLCVTCQPHWAIVKNKGGYLWESLIEMVKKQSSRRDSSDFLHFLTHTSREWTWIANSSGPDLVLCLTTSPVSCLSLPSSSVHPSSLFLYYSPWCWQSRWGKTWHLANAWHVQVVSAKIQYKQMILTFLGQAGDVGGKRSEWKITQGAMTPRAMNPLSLYE